MLLCNPSSVLSLMATAVGMVIPPCLPLCDELTLPGELNRPDVTLDNSIALCFHVLQLLLLLFACEG